MVNLNYYSAYEKKNSIEYFYWFLRRFPWTGHNNLAYASTGPLYESNQSQTVYVSPPHSSQYSPSTNWLINCLETFTLAGLDYVHVISRSIAYCTLRKTVRLHVILCFVRIAVGWTYRSTFVLSWSLARGSLSICFAGRLVHRCRAGNAEFYNIEMATIWRIFHSCLIPILTYGAETWIPTKAAP